MKDLSEYLEINLNDRIYVKLEPKAYEHWRDYWNRSLPNQHKQPFKYFTAKADDEGWVEFQIWYFMEVFGPTISFGRQSPFSLNVRFHKSELTEPKNEA